MAQLKYTRRNIDSLDGLRGWSAIAVLAFHTLQFLEGTTPFTKKFIEMGCDGVPIFFAVSGFIVFQSLELKAKQDEPYRLHFYIRRAFRILPLWWGVLALSSSFHTIPIRFFIANALMYFGFFSYDPAYLPIEPSWSLFVEESFYLIIPWFVGALSNLPNALLFGTFMWLIHSIWSTLAAALGVPTDNWFIFRAPPYQFIYFAVGILTYLIWSRPQLSSAFKFKKSVYLTLFLDLAALISLFSYPFFCQEPILTAGLFLICALTEGSLLNRLFKTRLLKWVGRRCYAFYIGQNVASAFFRPVHSWIGGLLHLNPNQLVVLALFTNFVSALIFAEISWWGWEKPWQNVGEIVFKNTLLLQKRFSKG